MSDGTTFNDDFGIQMGISTTLQKIQTFPFYPLLLIAYPVVALMGININEAEPALLWRPLIVLVLIALGLLLLLKLLLKDWHRAALLLSILIFLFFVYGLIYFYLKKIEIAGVIIGRHRFMFPLWIGLAGLAVWWAVRFFTEPAALHTHSQHCLHFSAALSLLSDHILCHPEGAHRPDRNNTEIKLVKFIFHVN